MVFRLLRAPPLPQAVEEARRRHGWPPSPPRMFMVFDGIGEDENKCIFFFLLFLLQLPLAEWHMNRCTDGAACVGTARVTRDQSDGSPLAVSSNGFTCFFPRHADLAITYFSAIVGRRTGL